MAAKKEKAAKAKQAGKLKGIRLGFAISLHDLETKANLAKKFLEKGQKVKHGNDIKRKREGIFRIGKRKDRSISGNFRKADSNKN